MTPKVQGHGLDVSGDVVDALAAQGVARHGRSVNDRCFRLERFDARTLLVVSGVELHEELASMYSVEDAAFSVPVAHRVMGGHGFEVEEALGLSQGDLVMKIGEVILLKKRADEIAHEDCLRLGTELSDSINNWPTCQW